MQSDMPTLCDLFVLDELPSKQSKHFPQSCTQLNGRPMLLRHSESGGIGFKHFRMDEDTLIDGIDAEMWHRLRVADGRWHPNGTASEECVDMPKSKESTAPHQTGCGRLTDKAANMQVGGGKTNSNELQEK